MPFIHYKQFDQPSFADFMVYESMPPHPFWDSVAKHIDFSFADEICAPLYSPLGQNPYAPSLKLKVHLVQRYYDISDRETELKVIGDIFVKRFLGLPVTLNKFDHSTIALDRTRLGAEMFQVCHLHILSQALALGLWGQEDDRWLVDAFHTYANIAAPSTYELIQQSAQRVVRHLKQKNPVRYEQCKQDLEVGLFFRHLKRDEDNRKRSMALSHLVVQSYGLVAWLANPLLALRSPWRDAREEQRSQEHQQLLLRILQENVTQTDEDHGNTDHQAAPKNAVAEGAKDGGQEASESVTVHEEQPGMDEHRAMEAASQNVPPPPDAPSHSRPVPAYVELSKKEKPADRVVSAHDPEVRFGHKSKKVSFLGDKVQVVESSTSKLILNAEPIPGNEGDGEALIDVLQPVIEAFDVRPQEVVADSAYGSGDNRKAVQGLHTRLTAPIPKVSHPAHLFPHDAFTYLPEDDQVVCPGQQRAYRKTYIKGSQGTQHIFHKEICAACPLRAQCTNSQTTGRTVFISDHWEMMQAAKAYNASAQGQEALEARYEVERKNNEMKSHCGLAKPRTRGRNKLRIDVKITSMVVNIKTIIKKEIAKHWIPPIKAPVCP